MTSLSRYTKINPLKTLQGMFPSYELFKSTWLTHVFEGVQILRPVYFFIDRSKSLNDIQRVKMAFITPIDSSLQVHEVHGSTVMHAFHNSSWLGHKWVIGKDEQGDDKLYNPSRPHSAQYIPVAGELLFDGIVQISKPMKENGQKGQLAPSRRKELYQAMRRMQGLSDYVYFYGRAKSLMIACYQLMLWHREISPEDVLFGEAKNYPAPIKLANRAHVLHIDLMDFKGYTPANKDLQFALDGLQDALLSLRNSVTAPTKLQEKEWRGRASSGLLLATIKLKSLHDAFVKGGV